MSIGVSTIWYPDRCTCGRPQAPGDRIYSVSRPDETVGTVRCEACIAPLFQRYELVARGPDPECAAEARKAFLTENRGAIVERAVSVIWPLAHKQFGIGDWAGQGRADLSAAEQLQLDTAHADLDELRSLGLDDHSGDDPSKAAAA